MCCGRIPGVYQRYGGIGERVGSVGHLFVVPADRLKVPAARLDQHFAASVIPVTFSAYVNEAESSGVLTVVMRDR